MDKLMTFIFAMVIGIAFDLFLAQVVCFGLSQYHIQSGIAGPFLLLIVATSVISLGSRAGSSDLYETASRSLHRERRTSMSSDGFVGWRSAY